MSEYNKLHYKQLKIDIKPTDKLMIDDFCKKMEISKAQFVCSACKYFVKLGELPPEE